MDSLVSSIGPVLEHQKYPATIRDHAYRILYANRAARDLFGVSNGQAGLMCHQVFHKRDRPLRQCFCGVGAFGVKITNFYEPSVNALLEYVNIPISDGNTLMGALNVMNVLDNPTDPKTLYGQISEPVVLEGRTGHWPASGDGGATLTSREREVFGWIQKGKSNAETGHLMGISENTVNFHTKNIFVKLGAENRTHAVTLAYHAEIERKDTIMKELHHRVYNNFSILASTVALHASDVAQGADAGRALKAIQAHVQSMATLHGMMVEQPGNSCVQMRRYFETFSMRLQSAYGLGDLGISLVTNVDDAVLRMRDAITCAQIASELITNAVKHAFAGMQTGVIELGFMRAGEQTRASETFLLMVRDNGCRTSAGHTMPGSAGMRIVDNLVAQLGGTLEVKTDEGSSYSIKFKTETCVH